MSLSAKNCRTVSKFVAQCQEGVIPYIYTLRRATACAYRLRNANTYLNTCIHMLLHTLPILIHWLGFRFPILIYALPISIHWVSFRVSAPYLNTYTAYLYTNTTRQPTRIEDYITRVVSQSESGITSLECFRLRWKTFLGSRLFSARYSLS